MKSAFRAQFHEMTPVMYVSLSHFLVLFGYKLFSLYYPLFLEQKGFSFEIIGSMYMFLYGSMALFSLATWSLLSKKRIYSKAIIATGMMGYAAYSIGMLFARSVTTFYLWQVELGLSAALFYVGMRSVIMEHKSKSYDKDFLYFYSAPFYSNFLAPTIGGVILWAFSFREVFITSLLVYFIAVAFAVREWEFIKTDADSATLTKKSKATSHKKTRYEMKIAIFLAAAFIAMFSAGVYRSFFVLLLKNEFYLSKSWIVGWISITSLISIIISWKLAKFVEKRKSENNLLVGNSISSIMALGVATCFYLPLLFIIYLIEYSAKLVSESGKSGLIARMFRHNEEEGAVLDTFITALGVAVGSLVAGFVAHNHGIRAAFLMDGIALGLCAILCALISRRVN